MPETPSTMTPSMTALLPLLSADHGATSADLAERGGIGRSTANRTLAGLEARGLARRVSDERTSGVRSPDQWFTAMPDEAAESVSPGQGPVAGDTDTGESGTIPTPGNDPHENDPASTPADAQTRPAEAENAGTDPELDGRYTTSNEPEPTTDTAPTSTDRTPETASTQQERSAVHGADPTDPAPEKIAVPNAETAATAPQTQTAGPARLAKGGLRALVAEHLTAHPDQEFTAPKLARILGRSSGAISNVFDTLIKTGQAEMTCEKPRTFRHLPSHTGR
jgi:MarR family